MKQNYTTLILLLTMFMSACLSIEAQVPSYYNGTDISKTGNALKTELSDLVSATHTTQLSYTPGVWEALKQTDLDPNNPGNVLLIYGYDDNDGNTQTDRTRSKDLNGGNVGEWNREHVFPKSLGNPNLGTSGPGSDAHHIRPSDVQFNSLRSNLPFEDASGNARRINNSWYPGDEWKGDVARMIMYMYIRYGNRCLPTAVGVGSQTYSNEMVDIFLEWNAEDPVSQIEINRNNILENLQGNRNPFIDNPAFATSIWGGPQAEDIFGDSTPNPNPTVNIVINEIDADTPGSDNMEFIELYDGGTGNTSLDGMAVVLYNGSNNESYTTFDLTGYQTDANGYFVLGNDAVPNAILIFSGNTLQNGADAVALYDSAASNFPNGSAITTTGLIDAVVYDTNDADDAELLALLNPGQPQLNEDELSDKDNQSLQRIPNGQGGTRNTNSYTNAVPTPGSANTNGSTEPETPNILINEIDADTDGTDIMEFIELYDGGTGNSALNGFVVVLYNGSNNLSYAAFDLTGYQTDANGYFVLGNNAVPNTSIVFPGNTLQNGADAVALYTGTAADFPNGSAITTNNLVDAIAYDTNDADDAELLTLLNPGQPQLNEDEAGDKNNHSLQRIPNGSGGARNTSTYIPAPPTPGSTNSNGQAATIIINEIDADTSGSDTLEFIELYDGGVGNTALDGLVIVLYNGSIDQTYAAFDLTGYTTNAEGYFVLGNEAVPNVSLVFPGNTLQNGADAVALYNGSITDFPNGSAISTNNLVDAIVYDTNDSDDAELLSLLNPGQPQVNEGELGDKDNHSLQRMPNGDGGALNTISYIPAIPTPGTSNDGTTNPNPGGDIIAIADARNTADGNTVTITGILTVSDQFAGSAYIQDNTGAIAVFDGLVHGDGVFQIGDSITLTGTRSTYNNQAQISPVSSVTNNGIPNNAITPRTISLNELANYPGELVRIQNISFPTPGDMMFGNSNYIISDSSGNAELRIDNDASDIVGLAQPEACNEIIGVVGRFMDIYQLLPRMKSDLPCADKYIPTGDDLTISKDLTLDVVAWNIEWFGDETNSPAAGNANSDLIQKDSVRTILASMDADVIAVEEISDDILFAQLVSELPGYDFVLSDATSYPNDTEGTKQKVGFIYKTATISPVSTKPLLASMHPYYNGGDASMLPDYPDDPTRFFASGRLPFLMTANVIIDGVTEEINFVALHARANSGTAAQNRYDMRKYDVEVLKDTLDAMYGNSKVIVLGDYNDDVDETVADITSTTSSYEAYINAPGMYNVVTSTLSNEQYRSYVFRENMIDHIMVTNEMESNYISGSSRVGYEYYDGDYTYTVSDHFPVSARFQMQALEVVSLSKTDVTCNGSDNGQATVVVKGGIAPYTYEWNNGISGQNATGLTPGEYTVTITDALNNSVSANVTITEPDELEFSVTGDLIVYPGYSAKECTTLTATNITGGTPGYHYIWSTGDQSQSITVCPSETTTYSVTVIDDNGCEKTLEVTVEAIDILCGNRSNKIQICYRGKTLCLPEVAAKQLLRMGATLGSCNTNEPEFFDAYVYPNPVFNTSYIHFKSKLNTSVNILIFNDQGQVVYSNEKMVNKGKNTIVLNLSALKCGIYFCKMASPGGNPTTVSKILKL